MLCCSRDGRHLCTIRGICATPMGVLASSPLLAARVTSSESPRCAGVRVLFCYAVSFVRALGAYLYGSLFSSPCRNIGVSAVLSGRVDVVSRVVPLCKLVHSAQRCAQLYRAPGAAPAAGLHRPRPPTSHSQHRVRDGAMPRAPAPGEAGAAPPGVRPCAARVTSGLRAQDRGTGDARHPIRTD